MNNIKDLSEKSPVNFQDLTGQRFGRLTVVGRVPPKTEYEIKNYVPRWLCRCDCGKETTITVGSLRTGNTTSCGCYAYKIKSLPVGKASENAVLSNYTTKCKRKNISFELTKEEFLELTRQNCFYCGRQPYQIGRTRGNNGNYVYNGVDRIDSSKGYTLSNCVSCCGRCNKAKLAETQSDFFEWIKTIHSNLSNKGLI
jgi:hypothetical protein